MLLTFLQTRPGSVLLLDEPDAHLHVILQDAIYSELRAAAARQPSQLVIATHSEALRLVRADLPAVELIDGDARPEIQATTITGEGFQRLRWRRYEIESYLLHPEALARFVTQTVGAAAAPPHLADLRRYLEEN